jgi:hypothetical protein
MLQGSYRYRPVTELSLAKKPLRHPSDVRSVPDVPPANCIYYVILRDLIRFVCQTTMEDTFGAVNLFVF